jgi:hypothetical protein
VEPWNQADFVKAVRLSRDILHNMTMDWLPIWGFQGRSCGGCDFFYSNYLGALGQQPGFTDVPPGWYPRYYQYRMILQDFLFVVSPMSQNCSKCTGTLSPADAASIDAGVPKLYDRAVALFNSLQP